MEHWLCPVCTTANFPNENVCASCEYEKAVKKPTTEIKFGFTGVEADLPVFGKGQSLKVDNNTAGSFNPQGKSQGRSTSAVVFNSGRLTFGVPQQEQRPSTLAVNRKDPQGYCKAMTTPIRQISEPTLRNCDPKDLVGKDQCQKFVDNAPGSLMTWGSSECDQLPLRQDVLTMNCRCTPALIKAFTEPGCTLLACGALSTYAVYNGELWSWGCPDVPLGRPLKGISDDLPCWNVYGDGFAICSGKVPGRVWGLPKNDIIVKVAAGDSHAVVITDAGDCYAWGFYRDSYGPIGFWNNDSVADLVSVPQKMPIDGLALDVASGENHTVILAQKDGKTFLVVMGSSEYGQLCLPAPQLENLENYETMLEARRTYIKPTKLSVQDLSFERFLGKTREELNFAEIEIFGGRFLHVYAGLCTTFIKMECSGITYWFGCGRGDYGELGGGFTKKHVYKPVLIRVPMLCSIEEICGGDNMTIGLATDGSVWIWGKESYCGLGCDSECAIVEPKPIPGLRNKVRGISCSGKTSYVCTHEGYVLTWGEGNQYQFGDGTCPDNIVVVPTLLPRKLFLNKWVLCVKAGSMHAVAICVQPEFRGTKRQREWESTVADELPSVMKKARPDVLIIRESVEVANTPPLITPPSPNTDAPRFGHPTPLIEEPRFGYPTPQIEEQALVHPVSNTGRSGLSRPAPSIEKPVYDHSVEDLSCVQLPSEDANSRQTGSGQTSSLATPQIAPPKVSKQSSSNAIIPEPTSGRPFKTTPKANPKEAKEPSISSLSEEEESSKDQHQPIPDLKNELSPVKTSSQRSKTKGSQEPDKKVVTESKIKPKAKSKAKTKVKAKAKVKAPPQSRKSKVEEKLTKHEETVKPKSTRNRPTRAREKQESLVVEATEDEVEEPPRKKIRTRRDVQPPEPKKRSRK